MKTICFATVLSFSLALSALQATKAATPIHGTNVLRNRLRRVALRNSQAVLALSGVGN